MQVTQTTVAYVGNVAPVAAGDDAVTIVPIQCLQTKAEGQFLTGADVRAMRQHAGISQAELARRLRYSRQYICDLESGRRSIPLDLCGVLFEVLAAALQRQAQLRARWERLGRPA